MIRFLFFNKEIDLLNVPRLNRKLGYTLESFR